MGPRKDPKKYWTLRAAAMSKGSAHTPLRPIEGIKYLKVNLWERPKASLHQQ
jgi:hypothetical protein